MTDKNDNLEVSRSKMIVRLDLQRQTLAMAEYLKKQKKLRNGSLYLCTLPGKNWIFETMLMDSFPSRKIGVTFNCAERDRTAYDKARPHMPTEGIESYQLCDFDSVLCDSPGHISWGDYCGLGKTENILSLVQALAFSGSVAVYGTFYANPRKYAKKLKILLNHSKSQDYIEAIQEEFDYWFRWFQIKTKAKLIYKNVYNNGQGNRMLTIGFARVGTPVVSVIREPAKKAKKNEHSPAVHKMFERLIKKYGFKKNSISGKDKAAVNREIALAIGISNNRVGSIIAHYLNPKSFGK